MYVEPSRMESLVIEKKSHLLEASEPRKDYGPQHVIDIEARGGEMFCDTKASALSY